MFISMNEIRKIGDDVILIGLTENGYYKNTFIENDSERGRFFDKTSKNINNKSNYRKNGSYIRYRKVSNNKLN